jgi:hypothetical protein
VQVFGRRHPQCQPRARAAGVRKAPRHEIAVGKARRVQQALWRIGRSVGLKEVGRERSTRSLWLGGRCWCWHKPVDRTVHDQIGGASAGQSDNPVRSWALPAVIQHE